MKQKAGSSEKKINKIDKSLAGLTQIKGEKSQISNIRNERGDITTDSTAVKGIRKYYKQLHAHKFNVEEMDQFLKTHKLPKLYQDEIDHLNSPVTSKEIAFA